MTKPPPNPITGSDEMDAMMRINTELMSELWILRDRVTVLEKLLEDKGVVARNDINDYAPEGEFAKELDEERERFVRRVAGAPWEVEFTVESLVERGQR
ncbi:MAG: hypothetical protein RIF37_15565 [Rhodospirillaceae bacterium]|jgi:hypothetical protein